MKSNIFAMNLIMSLVVSFSHISCSSNKKIELKSEKPAEFTYMIPPHSLGIKIRNIGNVTIKGSMPKKAVITITKKVISKNKESALNLMDKIKIMPKKTDSLISIVPEFPAISENEKVSTDIFALIPLNQNIPIAVALSDGKLECGSVKGELKSIVTSGQIHITTSNIFVDLKIDQGNVSLGNKIKGGKIEIGKGNIYLRQRLKNPDKDLFINVQEGDVKVELVHGTLNNLEFIANKIENKTSIKLKNGKLKNKGKLLKITVKKGKIILTSELF